MLALFYKMLHFFATGADTSQRRRRKKAAARIPHTARDTMQTAYTHTRPAAAHHDAAARAAPPRPDAAHEIQGRHGGRAARGRRAAKQQQQRGASIGIGLAQTGLSEKRKDAIGGGERGPASQFAAEGAAARLKRESSRLVLASVCHQASSSEFNPRAADAARNWKGAIKAIGLACAAGSRRPRGIGGSARPKLCTSARPHLACRKSGSLASLWRAHCHAATTHPQQR